MKCTHIGLEDQAAALAGPPAHKGYAYAELSGIRRVSGGVLRHKVSRADGNGDPKSGPEHGKTPSEKGVSSLLVTDFQQVSVDVSSGGGGNCTRVSMSNRSVPRPPDERSDTPGEEPG